MKLISTCVGWAEPPSGYPESHRERETERGREGEGENEATTAKNQSRPLSLSPTLPLLFAPRWDSLRSSHPAGRTGPRSRRGYALVELIVVISVNTVLMAVAVALLGTLLRTEHQGQYHYERASSLVRLANQFRSDVAASRSASLVAANAAQGNYPSGSKLSNMLRFFGDPEEQTIEFLRDGDRIRRVEYQGTNVVRREAYTLIDLTDTELVVTDQQIVSLRLAFGDDAWRIDAQTGRDWRFAQEKKP
jgi:Tfp pilus assembly protein FimT